MTSCRTNRRTAIRRARRTGIALAVSLTVSGALAAWMLIQTLSGSSGPSLPRAGERIEVSFAGLRDTRGAALDEHALADRKSTRLNSSHLVISYAVFCLKKKKY